MKKLAILALVSVTLASCEEETTMAVDEVPTEITTYTSTHFPENAIVKAVKDKEKGTHSYEISLEGGYYLEFNSQKEVTDIEGVSKLPDSSIPTGLLEYVQQNYPDFHIVGWETDGTGQELELNSGLELKFNAQGEFLRIDN
ncbi:MAG: PepSY-like domain-containing protein [Breznakibacter sp.]